MAEFRTTSGLVSCTPMMRTASGLVELAPQFRTASGLIDCGSGSALSASIDPAYVTGARSGPSQRVSTNLATVTVSGGKAPYSYAWGAVTDWQISSPTSAATTFSAVIAPGGDKSDNFACTVTDARGDSVIVNVVATVFNYGGSGGILP